MLNIKPQDFIERPCSGLENNKCKHGHNTNGSIICTGHIALNNCKDGEKFPYRIPACLVED